MEGQDELITAENISDEMLGDLARRYGDEWVEYHGRRLRLSWWIWEALHTMNDTMKMRARKVCADFINERDPGLGQKVAPTQKDAQ